MVAMKLLGILLVGNLSKKQKNQYNSVHKRNFSVNVFFSNCDQIRVQLQKAYSENLIGFSVEIT